MDKRAFGEGRALPIIVVMPVVGIVMPSEGAMEMMTMIIIMVGGGGIGVAIASTPPPITGRHRSSAGLPVGLGAEAGSRVSAAPRESL